VSAETVLFHNAVILSPLKKSNQKYQEVAPVTAQSCARERGALACMICLYDLSIITQWTTLDSMSVWQHTNIVIVTDKQTRHFKPSTHLVPLREGAL
jgi:hypothetical protein